MAEPVPSVPEPEAPTSRPTAGSPTRGFLFSDLRDYTRYLETHGAADAAALLVRYRTLVRTAVAKHDGAEIKTEGDSFYVVFPAVSQAVLCGLAIIDAAAGGTTDADARPIPAGIGIHAGETVETPDGYVGAAVNIAARICAIAGPGEVLVSDTVRALAQTVLPVAFEPRGRRTLKGVAEPLAVFAVARTAAAWAPQRRRATRRRRLLMGAISLALALVAAGAAWIATRPPPGLPPGPWTIGFDMQLTGDYAFTAVPVRDAVQMAIDEVNAAGGIGGSPFVLDVRDHGVDGPDGANPDQGAANVTAFVGDPKTVAMIGPYFSGIASEEIPITNAAGLLQCSPANTDPRLTKPRDGALDLRAAFPERINYIRTAPADDIHGLALASFVYGDLEAGNTLVIDTEQAYGPGIADQFAAAYERLGGLTVRRTLNPGADPATVLEPLLGPDAPEAVVWGGYGEAGAPLRNAMAAAGKANIPFLSWDGIGPGPGTETGSFLQLAGSAGVGSYFSHAAIALPKADFVERYQTRFGIEPDEYAAAGYACAQVIFESLRAVALTGPSLANLREAVRAYAVDSSHRFETVIGTIGFDANGDSLQQFVTFYRVDPSAAGGRGDWVIEKQQDFGPPR
jgi:ABC-type branched-subunit amino acid transport system substrate-binding protein